MWKQAHSNRLISCLSADIREYGILSSLNTDSKQSYFVCSSDLQSAIEKEDYALAAELRDKISKLEAESLAASAKALAHENAQYVFRLGQKVTHKIFGK